MWSRASTDSLCPAVRAALTGPRTRRELLPGAGLAIAMLFLAACSSAPPSKPTEASSQPVAAEAGKSGANASSAASGAAAGGASASANGGPISARGKADFDRAVGAMKAGNTTEAELEFKQVALQFPQLSSPYVNLGILYRKAGRLDQSEQALKTAVEHNEGSAVAWTELGATQRLRGEFPSAAASYEKAIAADPNYAPAYRNLGVVSDLYLGDPERALTAFERYKELSGEEKPVSGWIAELRQRTGKPPLKRPSPPTAAGSSSEGGPAGVAADGAASGTSSSAPAAGTAPDPAAPNAPATSAPGAAVPKVPNTSDAAGPNNAPARSPDGAKPSAAPGKKPAEASAGATPPKGGD